MEPLANHPLFQILHLYHVFGLLGSQALFIKSFGALYLIFDHSTWAIYTLSIVHNKNWYRISGHKGRKL